MFDKRAGISPVSRRKKVVEVARAVLEPPMQSKRCWEGLLTFPRPQTHLGGHQSPPRPLFPCEVAQAIISGAILGLLPNHLEYLIRGESSDVQSNFGFQSHIQKAGVNPELPSRQKRR